jgi:hypothetical protein
MLRDWRGSEVCLFVQIFEKSEEKLDSITIQAILNPFFGIMGSQEEEEFDEEGREDGKAGADMKGEDPSHPVQQSDGVVIQN